MAEPKFLAPMPMTRLRSLASKARGSVAVPFLGTNASVVLPLKAGSVLVTRVTAEDVRQGLVAPRELLRYLDAGVEIHSCANLHAKVYVFGRRAVIGSANVSRSSERLVEAALEVTDAEAVAQAKAFVDGLRVEPVSRDFVQTLLPLYREDRVGGWSAEREAGAGPRSNKTGAVHSRMWIMPLIHGAWDEDTRVASRDAEPHARRRMENPQLNRLEAIEWFGGDQKRLNPGERVIQRLGDGRGFLYEPPARIVHVAPYDGGRKAIVFLERRKHLRLVDSKTLRQRLGKQAAHFTRATHSLHLIRSGDAASEVTSLWPALNR